MKFRLSAVILAEPFSCVGLMQGKNKDGNLSVDEGFTIDKVDEVLVIRHRAAPELVKCVPWADVADATIATEQPEWSDWPAVAELISGKAAAITRPAKVR